MSDFDYGHNSAPHFVEWDPATGEGRFVCRGDETSTCHQFPDCGCEQWGDDHDVEHPRVANSYCWIQPWLESNPMDESYAEFGVDLVKRDAAITTEWDGDCVLWEYAKVVPE